MQEFSIENLLFFDDTRRFKQKCEATETSNDDDAKAGEVQVPVAVTAEALRIYRAYLAFDAPDQVRNV